MTQPASIAALPSNVAPDLTGQYNTPIPAGQEKAFAQWVDKLPVNLRSSRDYDLQGAFLAGVTPSANAHFPDTFKKPSHVSFSNQSKYSTPDNMGGIWNGDNQFTPSSINYQYHFPSVLQRLILEQNPQPGFYLNTVNSPR